MQHQEKDKRPILTNDAEVDGLVSIAHDEHYRIRVINDFIEILFLSS